MANKYLKTIAVLMSSLLLIGCQNGASSLTKSINNTKHQTINSTNNKVKTKKSHRPSNNFSNSGNSIGGLSQAQYTQLKKMSFKPGTYGFVEVNNNKSTLIPNSWKVNTVIYQNLDRLNRTSSSNTGFLEKRNIADGSLRIRQFIEPTGWHYNHGQNQIYNRGHLIAYSISAGIDQSGKYNPSNQSGDQNNPKNLFTQSAYSNQQLQTIFEKKVRDALRANKKVIFQATPIFKDNEKMARGVNLQAVSTDNSLNFNVYIFNVQPGYTFNYNDGSSKTDKSIYVKKLPPQMQSHYGSDNRNSYFSRKYYYYPGKAENSRRANSDYKKFTQKQYSTTKKHIKSKLKRYIRKAEKVFDK